MIDPDLDGRTALVTGSATGVGRAIALSLADCGAGVAINYRSSEDAAEETTAAARERGADAVAVQADVTTPDGVASLFERVEDALATVDVLVNNVGAFAPKHWAELSFEEWRGVWASNVDATYLCAKQALPAMRDGGWGRVVNVGYASAEKGLVSPTNFPYFAAKASVLMFTRMLAADTQDDGITVNAVSPYVVENSAEFPQELPRGRPADFEDVTAAVRFFLDEEAAYLSGENVEVDGGWLPEDV